MTHHNIIRQATKLGMSLEFTTELVALSTQLKALTPTMRNAIYFATAISPLVILCPKSFSNLNVRRNILLAVSQSILKYVFQLSDVISLQQAFVMGNQRPAALKKTEHLLWKLLFSASAGLDRTNEFETFFETLDDLKVLEGDIAPQWFLGGKLPYFYFYNALFTDIL